MTIVIGLTGSIASGKSTVSRMFNTLNIPVVDADQIARDVVNPGEQAYKDIIEVFGKEILLDDLSLDRKKLGSIIFADKAKRKQLNDIVHPAIRTEMLKQRDAYINSGERYVVLDIPLLFESKLTSMVDEVLVVFVNEKEQLKRLMDRDAYTVSEAKQRIDSQIPVKDKVKLADAVIDNNGTKEESYGQLKKLLNELNTI